MLRKYIFIICALFTEVAFPISRIGNNSRIRDPQDQYSLTVPKDFASITEIRDGGLVLASGRFASSPPLPVDIQMQSFRSQYPALVNKGQGEIESFFNGQSAIKYQTVPTSNGSLSLFGESQTAYVAISVCENGRGYVLFAPKLDLIAQGMIEALQTTTYEVPCLK